MRYQNFTYHDTVGFIDGDGRFSGIDMTRDPDKVAQGRLALAQNTRLRTGTAKQRFGTQIPGDFNPTGGFSNSIVGSGIFKDPNGDEVLLIAPANATYVIALRFGKDPVQINYSSGGSRDPTGNNGNGQVEFVQCFDQVMLLRIPGSQNLVWNGNYDQSSNSNKWQYTQLSANGLNLVPPMWQGEPWGDRVALYQAYYPAVPNRDTWLVTDLYDYTSYDPVYQAIRTNAGDSDTIVRIMQYYRTSVVIFKTNSIHMGTDLGTYPFTISQRMLTGSLGGVGVHTQVEVGGDILFPSQPNGIYRLSEVINDQIIALPLPISEPIQSIIDNINWPFMEIKGCSAALDNYAFFGICYGAGAQRPNMILVYNTQSREWESAGDTWADPDFAFDKLEVLTFAGSHRLVAIDYVTATIYLLYEGIDDNIASGTFSVPFKIQTRGYFGDDQLAFKKYGRATCSIASWAPSVNVNAITDGVNEVFPLTPNPITKNPDDYYTHGTPPYDSSTGDPNAPYREDYSITGVDNFVCEDFEDLIPGTIPFLPPTLFQTLGNLQQSTERFMVRQIGRWCGIEVENNKGHIEVQGITVEGQTAVSTIRTAA